MKRIDKVGLAFILPSVIAVLGLLIYPLLSSFFYSSTNRHLLRQSYDIVWLDNFVNLLTSEAFWRAFSTSAWWTVGSVSGQLLLGLLLALALDRVRRCTGLYRTLLIIPWAFPAIIIGFGWTWILNDVYGFLPNLLTRMG
ncbi:carbohydrate ABC transporter permease, partial [Pseudactinotalea sp. Z1732]